MTKMSDDDKISMFKQIYNLMETFRVFNENSDQCLLDYSDSDGKPSLKITLFGLMDEYNTWKRKYELEKYHV